MFDRFFATSPAGGRGKRAGGPGQALKGVIALLDNRDNRQYRTFDLRRAEAHRIEGYAVVFNVPTVLDRDPHSGAEFREVIHRHALDGCDMTDVVLNIDHEGTPLARTRAGTLTLTPDEHGLKVSATLSTSRGLELWEDIQAGNLDKMSFAFSVDSEHYDPNTRTRTILAIGKLWDVSVVTRPAYEQTEVYARSSMAEYMEAEHRTVARAVEALRAAEVNAPPLTREQVMQNPSRFGAALLDLSRRSALVNQLENLRSWQPEGKPEDVNTAQEKTLSLKKIIRELEQLDQEMAEKKTRSRYGADSSGGLRVVPPPAEFVAYDILTGQGCARVGRSEAMENARALGEDTLRWIARACGADEAEVVNKYLIDNQAAAPAPPAPPAFKTLNRSEFSMENIETRALQSYLCKGVPNMTEEEQRALTTTGSGNAVIPTTILDRLISTAGLSILTHRATHLADGRPGKLVIPVAPTAGGVGWHQELADISAYDQTLSAVTLSGAELVKLICASRAMVEMATENFETYLVNLLAGEVLDVLEDSYITGKAGTDNCPGDGLDNLTLTGRTVSAATSISVADIAKAVALLPAKVQRGGLVLANASTLAGVLTQETTYAFDPSNTLHALGVELVQDPHVADNTLYVVGELSQTLFLNFWQSISVRRSEDAMLAKNAVAFLASTVCGFAWNATNVAKVTVSA